jgi:hypothetical protein
MLTRIDLTCHMIDITSYVRLIIKTGCDIHMKMSTWFNNLMSYMHIIYVGAMLLCIRDLNV